MRRTETPKPIWIKFCTVVDIPVVVKYANFGDHRLRGFWVAGGQISPSPIDFHRRPYNTLALPCERVIKFAAFYWSAVEKNIPVKVTATPNNNNNIDFLIANYKTKYEWNIVY